MYVADMRGKTVDFFPKAVYNPSFSLQSLNNKITCIVEMSKAVNIWSTIYIFSGLVQIGNFRLNWTELALFSIYIDQNDNDQYQRDQNEWDQNNFDDQTQRYKINCSSSMWLKSKWWTSR